MENRNAIELVRLRSEERRGDIRNTRYTRKIGLDSEKSSSHRLDVVDGLGGRLGEGPA